MHGPDLWRTAPTSPIQLFSAYADEQLPSKEKCEMFFFLQVNLTFVYESGSHWSFVELCYLGPDPTVTRVYVCACVCAYLCLCVCVGGYFSVNLLHNCPFDRLKQCNKQ